MRKLGRTSTQRKALLRGQATDLIIHERIETTEAKAKELRRRVEKLITLGKRGDLHARRQAAALMYKAQDVTAGKDSLQKLFDDVAPRYTERQGGYTRIIKLGARKGDGAETVIIELV